MRKEHMIVRFGGISTPIAIAQFDSVGEARLELDEDDLLRLIDAAYRQRQLAQARQDLERHPRGSR